MKCWTECTIRDSLHLRFFNVGHRFIQKYVRTQVQWYAKYRMTVHHEKIQGRKFGKNVFFCDCNIISLLSLSHWLYNQILSEGKFIENILFTAYKMRPNTLLILRTIKVNFKCAFLSYLNKITMSDTVNLILRYGCVKPYIRYFLNYVTVNLDISYCCCLKLWLSGLRRHVISRPKSKFIQQWEPQMSFTVKSL